MEVKMRVIVNDVTTAEDLKRKTHTLIKQIHMVGEPELYVVVTIVRSPTLKTVGWYFMVQFNDGTMKIVQDFSLLARYPNFLSALPYLIEALGGVLAAESDKVSVTAFAADADFEFSGQFVVTL